MSGAHSSVAQNFSLTEGGPLHRLQIRLSRTRPRRQQVVHRALFATLVTWLPLLILSLIQRLAYGTQVTIPFLHDFAVNVRFVVALPILILAESRIDQRWHTLVLEFLRSRLVSDVELPSFEGVIEKITRLRDRVLPEAVMLTLAYLPSLSSVSTELLMAPGKGIDDVEVIKTTATVEKIDLEKRKLTLRLEDGKKKTYKVDKSVQNLDQVAVGDHLNLAYTEELLVTVTKSNASQASASLESVSVAPKGAKPGAVSVETTAISGKILAVDSQKHKLTFLDADDKKKTVKVGKNVGIDQLRPGETVNALLTESLVIDITK